MTYFPLGQSYFYRAAPKKNVISRNLFWARLSNRSIKENYMLELHRNSKQNKKEMQNPPSPYLWIKKHHKGSFKYDTLYLLEKNNSRL